MSKRILSVNGSKAMNYLLQTIFQKEYKVEQIDVFEAVYQLKSNNVSAVIVDIDYHPLQGWELIEHIKSSKIFDIPVLVLTTENTETLQKKCYELGVEEIFFKPFNPVDMIATIKAIAVPV
jgi:putative two-component system response regulator